MRDAPVGGHILGPLLTVCRLRGFKHTWWGFGEYRCDGLGADGSAVYLQEGCPGEPEGRKEKQLVINDEGCWCRPPSPFPPGK